MCACDWDALEPLLFFFPSFFFPLIALSHFPSAALRNLGSQPSQSATEPAKQRTASRPCPWLCLCNRPSPRERLLAFASANSLQASDAFPRRPSPTCRLTTVCRGSTTAPTRTAPHNVERRRLSLTSTYKQASRAESRGPSKDPGPETGNRRIMGAWSNASTVAAQ